MQTPSGEFWRSLSNFAKTQGWGFLVFLLCLFYVFRVFIAWPGSFCSASDECLGNSQCRRGRCQCRSDSRILNGTICSSIRSITVNRIITQASVQPNIVSRGVRRCFACVYCTIAHTRGDMHNHACSFFSSPWLAMHLCCNMWRRFQLPEPIMHVPGWDPTPTRLLCRRFYSRSSPH